MVSIRPVSASSWRPENASTRDDRSSTVTGASTSALIALANANRSPAGLPARSSVPVAVHRSSSVRSSTATWNHDAALVRPSTGTP